MRKTFLFIIICLIFVFSFSAFSEDIVMNLYINQIPIELSNEVLLINDTIMVPLVEAFETLGAQVFQNGIINSYYLNTFVKINPDNNYYTINGKKYSNSLFKYKGDVLYVPLNLLNLAFDFNTEYIENRQVYLNANTIIQYRNYNSIPYRLISFDDEGARFSVPLDWEKLDEHTYGYDSNYGRISANFSTRELNDNIDLDLIMDTYLEHLTMEYKDRITFSRSDQKIYNYLTSNVLYIETNVNDILTKHVIHFVPTDNQVYIMAFRYPTSINESFILQVFENVMNTFYIDESSLDVSSEHYMEFVAARDYQLTLSSKVYSNMTVDNMFNFEGYFNTEELIDSLTVTVSRQNEQLEFYVPVENNAFKTPIYIPFGLGKHNVKVAITPEEKKITFDDNNQSLPEEEKLLLKYSVVNLNKKSIRYTIPTIMVQSDHNSIKSMSKLLTNKYHTYYSKAKGIYNFIVEYVEILDVNESNYSALDVYEAYEGTETENILYLASLLRAQDIPAKVVEGTNSYVSHVWAEAYLNAQWIIIDPYGDAFRMDSEFNQTNELKPGFNNIRSFYTDRYPTIQVLDH